MEEITLQALLEAGCHFGHKSERWHPKASDFIYTEKDGIHIIDLAKTKVGLEKAMNFIKKTVAGGEEVLFVGTKRQVQGVLKEEAGKAGAPYFVARWIGGFLTNWDSIRKNIDKIIRLTDEEASGAWKKFPKHEQSKLARYVAKLRVYYGGVLNLAKPPAALFILDIRKEDSALREGKRMGLPVIGVVDTNSDPTGVDYVIPANDDAVGSVQFIIQKALVAYSEGKALLTKDLSKGEAAKENKKADSLQEKQVDAQKIKQERLAVEQAVKSTIEEAVEKVNSEPVSVEKPVVAVEAKPKRGRTKKAV